MYTKEQIEELASGIPLLAQHKKAIDDYNEQLEQIEAQLNDDSISVETKEEILSRKHDLIALVESEKHKAKAYDIVVDFQKDADALGFEDLELYCDAMVKGLKVLQKHYPNLLPYDLIYLIFEFVKSIL